MATASDTTASVSLKDEGNAEFKAGNWLKAAGCYTKALKEDNSNAVLYSNRSAALLKLKKVTKAMEDAEEAIRLRPEWEKGYYRKAQVLEDQGKLPQALNIYLSANVRAPDNNEIVGKIRELSKRLKVACNIAPQQQGPQQQAAPAQAPQPVDSAQTVEAHVSTSFGSGPVAMFVLQHLKGTAEQIQDTGTDFPPELHFLPGDKPLEPIEDEKQLHVHASIAFTTPDTYSSFITDMRGQAERFDAQAVVAVIPKRAIQIPQVWLKPGYPVANGDGVFVQVEAKDHKRMWFLPVTGKTTPGKPIKLDVDRFAILHSLLR